MAALHVQIWLGMSTSQLSSTRALCSKGKSIVDPSSNRTSEVSVVLSGGTKLALTRRMLLCWEVDSGSVTFARNDSSVYVPSMKVPGTFVGTSLYTTIGFPS